VEDAQNSQGIPDLEAQAIRALFDRIKDLEDQVNILKSQLSPIKATELEQTETKKNELFMSSNLFITQFLDGAGI
jgi:serine O-acetyltransferase